MNHQAELGNAITTSIAIMASEHSPELHQLLAESGNDVDTSKSTDELLEAALKALKNSSSFRNGLANYLSEEAISSDENYGNYVDDTFSNFSFFKKKSKVGGFLNNMFIGNKFKKNNSAIPNAEQMTTTSLSIFNRMRKPDAIETATIPRGIFSMQSLVKARREQEMLAKAKKDAMLNSSQLVEVERPILTYEQQLQKDSNNGESVGFSGDNNFFTFVDDTNF
jgi:hypothetical protein